MKTREQINLVRKMNTPMGKLQAAQGQFVSSDPFDIECEDLTKTLARALFAMDMAAEHQDFPPNEVANMKDVLFNFGLKLAREWLGKDAELFQKYAAFLAAKRDHKPEQLLAWKRRVSGLYLDGGARPVKSILDHLSSHGITVPKSGKARKNFQKQVRDYCAEHNYRIAGGQRGAPTGNSNRRRKR